QIDMNPGQFFFEPAKVSKIIVNALGGDDGIGVTGHDGQPFQIETIVNGGDGNDGVFLQFASATFFGGNGNDSMSEEDDQSNGFIDGGAGNDSIALANGASGDIEG